MMLAARCNHAAHVALAVHPEFTFIFCLIPPRRPEPVMPKNYRKRRADEDEDEAPAGGAGEEDALPPEVLRCVATPPLLRLFCAAAALTCRATVQRAAGGHTAAAG